MIKLPKFRLFQVYEPGERTNIRPAEKNIFMNNVRLLDDPKSNRKLILIGTYNSSTLMSLRTQKILETAKPDKVLVESSPRWFADLRAMDQQFLQTNKDVQSVTPFNLTMKRFNNNLRNLVFKAKFYSWLLAASRIFPFNDENSHMFKPGIEAYRTAKWAAEHNKEVIFSGEMFNESVIEGLRSEKRMFLVPMLYRTLIGRNSHWHSEYYGNMAEISMNGVEAYTENLDQKRLEWLLKIYQAIIPHQKKVVVDDEDERLFHTIYKQLDGAVNVAVVNAWHLPGIEKHWRHTTGTEPATEFINPIGDFDIEEDIHDNILNDFLRRTKSKKAKSEPAVTSNYLTNYHKQNTEAERERHVFFHGYDDPELEHGLYNDENQQVKDLPYDNKHH